MRRLHYILYYIMYYYPTFVRNNIFRNAVINHIAFSNDVHAYYAIITHSQQRSTKGSKCFPLRARRSRDIIARPSCPRHETTTKKKKPLCAHRRHVSESYQHISSSLCNRLLLLLFLASAGMLWDYFTPVRYDALDSIRVILNNYSF